MDRQESEVIKTVHTFAIVWLNQNGLSILMQNDEECVFLNTQI